MSRASFRRQLWRTTSHTLALCALVLFTPLTAHAVHPQTGTSDSVSSAQARPSTGEGPVVETETEETEETDFLLTLSPQSPVLTSTATEFVFTVSLSNLTEEPLPAALVALSVTTKPVGSRTALTQPPAANELDDIVTTETSVLSAGQSRDLTVTVPAGQFPLTEATPAGVYQMSAELRLPPSEDDRSEPEVDTGSQTERESEIDDPADAQRPGEERGSQPTTLAVSGPLPITWQGLTNEQTSPLTFVVPLTLPANISVMPTQKQLSDETPRLLDTLEAAETAHATLAIDPRIIAGIRAYGEAAPAAARNLLDALETTKLPVFLLQYSDADPTAQAALGATELLEPIGLSFVTRNGVFPQHTTPTLRDSDNDNDNSQEPGPDTETESSGDTAEDLPPSDSGNTPSETEPQIPTLAELGTLTQAYPAAWPATGQIDQSTLELLRNEQLTKLVISSENAPNATTPRVTISDFTALVSDAHLTTLTSEWLNSQNRTEQSRIAASLIAELTLAGQQDTPGTLIALDRATAAETTAIPDLITTLLAQPGITPQAETDLPTQPTTLQSASPTEQRVEMLRAFTATSHQISALAPLLTTPEYLPEYQQLRLLNHFSTRYAAPDIDLEAASERITERDTELLTGVSAISTDTTHLVGTSSNVPVTLHNTLPFEATVTLNVTPGSAAIEVPTQDSSPITVPARGNSVHSVTVDSRVSSGETTLHVGVLDRDGDHTFAQLNMQLTLRSSYETVLLTVLGISAVSLFIAGLWRSVKRRKTTVVTAESEHDEQITPTYSSRE